MRRLLLLALAVAASSAPAPAQDAPLPIPNVLLIVREEIKPGEMPAHEQEAIHFVRLQRRANDRLGAEARDGRIALVPVAGNENEVTYVWPYASFAELEKKRKAADSLASGAMRADFEALPDARLHASQRDMIASFRPDLSYNVGRGTRMPQARYVSMQTLRLKPGHEDAYWDARRRILHKAYDAVGANAAFVVFQVRGGGQMGTYYIFRALKSLAELDTNIMAAARAKMGADRDDWDKALDRAVLFNDVSYYAINPRLSIVPAEFAAQDTAGANFWNPPLPERPAAAANRRASARRHHRR